MALRKSNEFLSIPNSFVIDAPEPANISYFWNFGSLLGTCLVIQLATGIFLAMHYSSNLDLAFLSVQHIMIEFAVSRGMKSILSEIPNILTIWVIHYLNILAIKFDVYAPNKCIGWRDKWKGIAQSLLLKIVGNTYGFIYGNVKKFDTIMGNSYCRLSNNSYLNLSYSVVFINVDRYEDWLEAIPSWFSSICIILIVLLSQIPKDNTTLNNHIIGTRDVTAESSIFPKRINLMRTRSHYSTNTSLKDEVISDKKNIEGKSDSKDKSTSKITSGNLPVVVYKKLNELKGHDDKFSKINLILGDPYFLIQCYEIIKSKPGNMTAGSNKATLDKLNFQWFEKVAKQLVDGTYQFTPARQTDIPKSNGKMRTLTISSPRDKIVQKAISVILEAIWEPIFLDCSHGFRPNRSTHSALKKIKMEGYAYPWVIEGDITKCFDTIPHSIIRREISNKVGCPNFLSLINKVISYKIIDEKGIIRKSKVGTPQGTICSPILANIVLHQLDSFMDSFKNEFNIGVRAKRSPKYDKLQRKLSKIVEITPINLREFRQVRSQMRAISSYDPMDPNFKRMLFIRYADDFVVFVKGNMNDCLNIKDKITNFLSSFCGLELNEDKTSISSTKKHFNFLGASITNNQKRQYFVKSGRGSSFKKVAVIRSLVKAPIRDLVNRLVKLGLAKRNRFGSVFPKGRTNLFNSSHYDIIQWYNSKITGLLNYYSFASNYPRIQYIVWLLQASCALTLTNKYKLNSMRSSFKKFGKYLRDPETEVQIKIPDNFKVKNEFQVKRSLDYDKFSKIFDSSWATKLTDTSFGKVCTVCGTKTDIEMHHVRKISNIRFKLSNYGYKSNLITSAMNRKQVPLCKYHHNILHKGGLGYWEIRRIIEYGK